MENTVNQITRQSPCQFHNETSIKSINLHTVPILSTYRQNDFLQCDYNPWDFDPLASMFYENVYLKALGSFLSEMKHITLFWTKQEALWAA